MKILQWPPPEIVAILKPMREVCQQKTGVSDGNLFTSCYVYMSVH